MKTFGSKKASTPHKQLLLVEKNDKDQFLDKKNAFLALFSQKPSAAGNQKAKGKVEKKTVMDTKKQLYFNTGGSTISKCDECGMEFNRIFEDDVKMHAKYHSIAVDGLPWNLVEFSPGLDGYLHIGPPDKTNQKAWQKVSELSLMCRSSKLW